MQQIERNLVNATHSSRVLVVGTGVSGLACALRLSEAGFTVEAWERGDVAHEVSSVAAAIWHPYLAKPREKVERWALETLRELESIAREHASSGVRICTGIEWFPLDMHPPEFLRTLPQCRELGEHELRLGLAHGLEFRVPVIDMSTFLPWLRARCVAAGVHFEQREIRTLDEALAASPIVVNCTGFASRELAQDQELVPIRGQVVRVTANVAREFILDENSSRGLCYVIPRTNDVVLGGSASPGREDLAPDARETAEILARARRHLPHLRDENVLSVKVGLRPGRKNVRLEAEFPRPGHTLIHDYGHGGAGVTLCFGCADEVVRLAYAAPSVEAHRD